MADRSNTWLSPADIVAGRAPGRTGSSPTSGANRSRTILSIGAAAVCTTVLFAALPLPLFLEMLRLAGVGLIILFPFALARFRKGVKPVFVIWWLVLISECIFFRESAGGSDDVTNAFDGKFPVAAYSEVLSWVLCFIALLACSENVRMYLQRLFKGDYRWITLFAMVCAGSFVFAPRPMFALAWSFKLLLAVLLVVECSIQIHDFRDTIAFLRMTFWAYVIIVAQPVIIAALRGEMFDEDGRMSTIVSPNALSPNAGVVLLLALTLFSKKKGEGLNKSAILLGIGACLVMILAASKTGILAGIFGGTLFYLLRRRVGSALTYGAAAAVLVGVLAITTPLGNYFHTYHEKEGAESFSGRTLLWKAVLPAIRQRPIIGHGYMSTEFMTFEVNEVGWAAPHLHNGFLEALYNNGVIGLGFILAICVAIPRNFYRALRRIPVADPAYRIAAGGLSLYVFLLINGCFNSSFGGKATAPFILFLSLVAVSNRVLELASQPRKNHATQRVTYDLAGRSSPRVSWSSR